MKYSIRSTLRKIRTRGKSMIGMEEQNREEEYSMIGKESKGREGRVLYVGKFGKEEEKGTG
jgi:hypothetical protein